MEWAKRVHFCLFFVFSARNDFRIAASESFSEQIPTLKLDINIYYESLCPDSRMFITGIFYPQYKKFSDYLNVHFIPFGKGNIKEDGSDYECQHGPPECVNNLIHGCALNVLPAGDEQVEFVNCAMIHKSVDGQRKCAEERHLTWNEIQTCANGESGISLALKNQYDTFVGTNEGPTFVPTIVFNNIYSEENQELALRNPSKVICRYLPTIPPCVGGAQQH